MPVFLREFVYQHRLRLLWYGFLSSIIAIMLAWRSYLYANFFDSTIALLDVNNTRGLLSALWVIILLELTLYCTRLYAVALHTKLRWYMNILVRVFGLNRLIDQDYTRLASVWSGKLLQIVHSGMESYSYLIYDWLRKFIELWVSFLVLILLLWSSHYFFLLYILGAIIFLRFFQSKAFERMKEARYRDKNLNEQYTQQTTKILMNFLMMKVFWIKDQELAQLQHLGEQRVNNYIRIRFWFNAIASLANLLLVILLFVSLWRFGRWYVEWTVTLQTLLFVFLLISFSRNQFYSFGVFVAELAEKLTYIHRYDEVVWHQISLEDVASQYPYTWWSIQIKDISFHYNSWDQLYDWLSLKIDAWQKCALVWKSGSWKSTLFKLLTRLVIPSSWDISIGNTTLLDIDISSLYQNIWYFYQDPLVFDSTVRENLALWWSYDDKLLMEALSKVSLDISLDQVIGEKGVLLSGWEKQRLALARIFVYDFDILLLDEPTSNLDPELEKSILNTVFETYSDKTILVISHREYVLKLVERIIEVKKGEIVSDILI